MTIQELIDDLQKVDDKKNTVYFDFCSQVPTGVSSWRGIYAELAIEYKESEYDGNMTVEECITMLKESIGAEFCGWKGGEYVMHEDTQLHVANPGRVGGTIPTHVTDEGWCAIIHTKYED